MTPRPKRLLFRLSKAPYGTSLAREALDAVLAAAAFEQDVTLLFLSDGIYQLQKSQKPDRIDQKNFTAAFGLFPLYGISSIYVIEEDLRDRGLESRDLQLPVTVIRRADVANILTGQDQIISF